jgi:hypothetical protein
MALTSGQTAPAAPVDDGHRKALEWVKTGRHRITNR